MKDRRLFLKVKIKSLAAESRIIRQEERKNPHARIGLAEHRRRVVRPVSRINNLAYGFIRGRSYRQMELFSRTSPNWKEVWKVIERFGVCLQDFGSDNGYDGEWSSYQQQLKAQEDRYFKWKLDAIEKVAMA